MVGSNVTPASVGLELDGSFLVLIPKGTPFPVQHTFTVPTARSQCGLEVRLLQGESTRADDNRMLQRLIIDRLQVAAASPYPLVFTVHIDAKGGLRVECRAQSTGRKLKIATESFGGLGRDGPEAMPGQVKDVVAAGAAGSSDLRKTAETSFDQGWGGVYVVLDCSGSMAGGKLDQIKLGVLDFGKEAIKKQYLVGLIRLETHPEQVCEPTKDASRLEAAMKSIEASGSTNMAGAVRMAHDQLKAFKGTRVIVVATDGRPDSVDDSLREGESAKQDGIEIITIGTGDAVLDFLNQLASRSDMSTKVSRDSFGKAVSSAHALLPGLKTLMPANHTTT